jgi:protein ImuB
MASAPRLYPWLTLPEVFDAPLELLSQCETASALLFGARRLLAQLQVWLRARQRGVLALELKWELDARRSNALHVDAHHSGGSQGRLELRTAQPTQDMGHLARLLAEQLARVTLPAPVLYLRLRTLQTQPLAGESVSLLPEDIRHGDSLHQLLERLSARLGPEQVRGVHATGRPPARTYAALGSGCRVAEGSSWQAPRFCYEIRSCSRILFEGWRPK